MNHMKHAFLHASFSREHTQVGCYIVDGFDTVVGKGHNRVPLEIRTYTRDQRRPYAIHAETIAVLSMTAGTHIPFSYFPAYPLTAYVTHHPCVTCMALLADHDVRRVVYAQLPDRDTYDPADLAHAAKTLGVELIHHPYSTKGSS